MHAYTLLIQTENLPLGDAIVGGATLLLAMVTVVLAWQARRDVGLTEDSIDLSRRAIEAQDMPFAVAIAPKSQVQSINTDVNHEWMWWKLGNDGRHWLQVNIWNPGKGPALVRDIRLLLDGHDLLDTRPGWVGEIAMAPGQGYDFDLPGPLHIPEDGVGQMLVYYAHTSGAEYMTRSHAYIGPAGVRCANFSRQTSDGCGRPIVS